MLWGWRGLLRVVESGERAAFEVDMTCGSYSEAERSELPQLAADASLGCGNAVALATLSPGEVVLDLGSGGGIDVLLSARRVAPGGRAYGLDMTDEMLELARKNRAEAGVENAEFLKGEIEDVPLPDGHVDVVVSNCVINLSTEKHRVIGEAFRVLKPGAGSPSPTWWSSARRTRCSLGSHRASNCGQGASRERWRKTSTKRCSRRPASRRSRCKRPNTYPPEQIAGLSGEDAEALREVPVASAFIRARKPEAL